MAELDKLLKAFSDKLVPSEEFLGFGIQTADQIFRVLQSSKKLSVDRVLTVGSIGKKTAVCVDPDFDLVLFLNDEHPYFKEVLDHIEDVLICVDYGIKNIKVTKYSVQFDMNGFSFDLLPATNLVTVHPKPGGAKLAKMQSDKTLEYIKSNPKVGYMYGSAVAEQNLEFFKNESAHVHDLIRLAKFWNKTLHLDKYLSGRSSLIELIAVGAGRKSENQELSRLQGFKEFLTMIANFETLNVAFFPVREIPDNVKRQRPLVLDPVNPYNNFAYFGKNKIDIMEKFKVFGQESLRRLHNFTSFPVLFEIQPKVIQGFGMGKAKWLVSSVDLELTNPKMEVRMSDADFKLKGFFMKEVQQCLLTSMAALALGELGQVSGNNPASASVIENQVQSCIDVNVNGKPLNWTDTTQTHKDFGVTLTVPVPGDSKRCVQVSAEFPKQ